MAATDTDYHQRDLYEHIAAGEYPSWTLKMQIMPFEDAKTYRFNPFDLTKVWPHGDYPLTEVGRLTLDRNVSDYHTEMEQAAFEPNNLVPGIALSPDKMLLARGFSYSDAHRARIGVNYKQIPVNAPKVPVQPTARTARCGWLTSPTPCTRRTPRAARRPTLSTTGRITGMPTGTWSVPPTPCARTTTIGARRARWSAAVLDDAARERLVSNVVGHLLDGVTEPVLQRAFAYWRNVDKSLGDRVEAGVRAGQE